MVQEVPHKGTGEPIDGMRYTMHTLVREIAADMLATRSAADRACVLVAFTELTLARGAELVSRGMTADALGPAQQLMSNELINFRELGRVLGKLAQLDALDLGQLDSCLALADMLRRRGQLAEAGGIERAVLRVREGALGLDNLDTVRTQGCLAASLRDLGQLKESEALARSVLTAMQEAHGLSHSDTLCAQASLAETLRMSGELEAAEALQRAVLSYRIEMLGHSHLDTVKARGCLAATLHKSGAGPALLKAMALQVEVVKALKSELGPDHLDTVNACADLAVTLGEFRAAQCLEEAQALQEQVLQVMTATLGSSHVETIRARIQLGATLSQTPHTAAGNDRNLKRLQKGTKMLQDSLIALEELLGPNHPTTVETRGRFEVARRNHERAKFAVFGSAAISVIICLFYLVSRLITSHT